MSASDVPLFTNMLAVVADAWESVAGDLNDNKECAAALVDAFGGDHLTALLRLFLSAGAGGAVMALLRIAALLPADAAAGTGTDDVVWQHMLKTPPTAPNSAFEPVAKVLCCWQLEQRLVGAVVQALTPEVQAGAGAGAGGGKAASALRRRARRRRSGTPTARPTPRQTLCMLRTLDVAIAGDMGGIRGRLLGAAGPVALADALEAAEDADTLTRLIASLETARDGLTASLAAANARYKAGADGDGDGDGPAAVLEATVQALAVQLLAKLALHAAADQPAGSRLEAPASLVRHLEWVCDSAIPALHAVLAATDSPDTKRACVSVRGVVRAMYDAVSDVVAVAADCAAAGGTGGDTFKDVVGRLADGDVLLVVASQPPRPLPDESADGDDDDDDDDVENMVPHGDKAELSAKRAQDAAAVEPFLLRHGARLATKVGHTDAAATMRAAPMRPLLRACVLPGEDGM